MSNQYKPHSKKSGDNSLPKLPTYQDLDPMTATQLSYEVALKQYAKEVKTINLNKALDNHAFDTEVSGVVDKCILDLIPVIQDKAGKYFSNSRQTDLLGSEIADFCGSVSHSDEFALLTVQALFNAAVTTQRTEATYSKVAIELGQKIEQSFMIHSFLKQNQKLVAPVMEKIINNSKFGHQYALKQLFKFLTEKVGLTKEEVWDTVVPGRDWEVNDNTKYAKVGSYFVTVALQALPDMFRTENIKQEGDRFATTYIVATEELLSKVKDVSQQLINKAFLRMPTVDPCPDWTNNLDGGYELNGLALKLPLMLKRTGVEVGQVGDLATKMVNNAQHVGWRINKEIVALANRLVEEGITLGKLIVPHSNMTAMQFMDATEKGKPMILALSGANDLMQHEAIYMPHCVDWRGRVYQYNTVLNVQSTDFGKSLLLFAEGSEMTPVAEEAIAAHLCNVFGNKVDKLPRSQKVAWAKENAASISDIAMFPYENAILWANGGTEMTPDDPWCFIAACIEYHQCVITKERTFTNLPCAVDATCSGIQIISAMMLDEVGAGYVNLLPSELPQDIYAHCATVSLKYIQPQSQVYHKEHLRLTEEQVDKLKDLMQGKYSRKLAKVVVMTVPYSAQVGTQTDDLKDKAKELGIELVGMEAWTLVQSLREALFETVPALKVMDQIGNEMRRVSAANEQSTFTWTSPSGVTVTQTKQVGILKGIKTLGKQMYVRQYLPEPDPSGHKSATCPNLVHSLDAALLHLTFAECKVPFGLIHDSVLARATDIDEIVVNLKKTFIDMFSEDILGKFALEVGIDITTLQKQGSLDLEQVMDSEYFFS